MASMGSSDEFMSFNVKTGQFKAYKHTLPASYPEVSAGAYEGITGNTVGITYDVAVDSQGDAWFTETRLGTIARVDPATGETTEYKPPETPNMNGIMVDSHDNVWFSDFMGHKLGKLDPKTKTFQMYQPPTQGARPYGIIEDRKTGDIWFADYNGNNITRFSPKTEKFVEYPIPTHGAYPRFVGQDSKGRIWFAEWWSGKIGVVDPGGSAAARFAIGVKRKQGGMRTKDQPPFTIAVACFSWPSPKGDLRFIRSGHATPILERCHKGRRSLLPMGGGRPRGILGTVI